MPSPRFDSQSSSGFLEHMDFSGVLHALKTNSSPLKMDGWTTSFLLGWPIFHCHVSFRGGYQIFRHKNSTAIEKKWVFFR